MRIGSGDFLLGDCFEHMATLPDASVDMILCDLPYGTTACAWDAVLPFDKLWAEYWRVAKANAAVVLTASQPFTTALIGSQIECFKYELIWDKVNRYTGALMANSRPLKRHENVCVFYKKQPTYNKQWREGKPYNVQRTGGHGAHVGNAKRDQVRIGLNDGQHNPCSILEIKGDLKKESGLHPTQKPVALFEYLIRTYTNAGQVVLDNTAGSGTTAIAAENAGRKWICIERDPDYYAKAVERVRRHVNEDLL